MSWEKLTGFLFVEVKDANTKWNMNVLTYHLNCMCVQGMWCAPVGRVEGGWYQSWVANMGHFSVYWSEACVDGATCHFKENGKTVY